MRLFIAVNFEEELKNKLYDIINNLKSHTIHGNFTHRENLHLTLVFIGETTRIEDVKKAMNKIEWNKFHLSMCKTGKFKRSEGDIYWFGIQADKMLSSINSQLCENLSLSGFEIESREFKPHLTLGREVIPKTDFNIDDFSKSIPELEADINKISLMQSQHIGGKLVYTEIYSVSEVN